MNNKTTKERLSILSGNFLEFYDFTLFAYMIPIISSIFFINDEIINSYILGYIFLAIGFLSRPIGAILFGFIGDKYGRTRALQISIMIMAISTTGIGILPVKTENMIYVILALTSFRILQGLSAGGEYSGAGLILVENSKHDQHFLGAILTSSALMGAFVASVAAAFSSLYDYPNDIWRFLFIFGGIWGFITFILRLKIKKNEKSRVNYVSWKYLINNHTRPLFYTFVCSGLMNVPFYIVTGFVNTYFIAIGKYTKTELMFLNALMTLFWIICTIGFGILSRRVCPKNMMIISSLGIALFALPFFILVNNGSFNSFILAELILILLSQSFVAPAFTTMAGLFPYEVRYRGLAIGNCLGIACLGGITPYLSSILIKYTEVSYSPAIFLFLVAISAFVVSTLIKQEEGYELFQINDLEEENASK